MSGAHRLVLVQIVYDPLVGMTRHATFEQMRVTEGEVWMIIANVETGLTYSQHANNIPKMPLGALQPYNNRRADLLHMLA